jgi:MFS family permease
MAEYNPETEEIVTWRSLPQKDQLGLLFFTRLVDIFQAVSIQAYLFYYIKSFDTSAPDATISSQAGLLMGSFTGAQLLTTLLWARVADSRWVGRKGVILVGLFGTAISCLVFGFSRNFKEALACRLAGGALNAIPSMVYVNSQMLWGITNFPF